MQSQEELPDPKLIENQERIQRIPKIKEEVPQPPPTKIRKTAKKSQANPTLLKKPLKSDESKLHQDIKNSLPKEVIDRIKVIVSIYPYFKCMFDWIGKSSSKFCVVYQASGRKKTIPVIPALPDKKGAGRCKGTRMQDAGATLSRNKLLKIVSEVY